MVTLDDLRVRQLGQCRHDSTLAKYVGGRRTNEHYVDEDDRVLFDDTFELLAAHGVPLEQVPTMEPADHAASSTSRRAPPRSASSPAAVCARV